MDLSHLSPCFSRLRRRKQGSLWWKAPALKHWASKEMLTLGFEQTWGTVHPTIGISHDLGVSYLIMLVFTCSAPRSNVKQVAGVARIQVWSCINDHFRYRTWRYQIYMWFTYGLFRTHHPPIMALQPPSEAWAASGSMLKLHPNIQGAANPTIQIKVLGDHFPFELVDKNGAKWHSNRRLARNGGDPISNSCETILPEYQHSQRIGSFPHGG